MANYSTDADLRPYEDIDNWLPRTRLNGGVSAAATSLTVDQVDAFPNSCTISIESEQMTVTARDLANQYLTVTRGANSTTAAIHSDNLTVWMTNFSFVHDEATRKVNEFLRQNGYDPDWQYPEIPKIYDETELKTPAVYYALYNLCTRQQTSGNDTWQAKGLWYLKRYDEAMGAIKPKVIALPNDIAVWEYDTSAATYTNRTVEANATEGTPFNILATSSDYLYFGADYEFTSLSCRMASRASYASIVWQYWDGNSWETLSVTDGTSSFTNVKDGQTISWGEPADWTPYSLSSGVDSRSRYWVRVSATVTTVGQAWYCGQSISNPYRMQFGGGSGRVGLAS